VEAYTTAVDTHNGTVGKIRVFRKYFNRNLARKPSHVPLARVRVEARAAVVLLKTFWRRAKHAKLPDHLQKIFHERFLFPR
jgi:hypothetical protein